jgi:transcriptional regulator with XRE-family HTH domain
MPSDEGVREQLGALGTFIREQRQKAELSLRELADRANISNPYLSQIERGLHEPSVRVLTSIADALELSADTLLRSAGLISGDDGGARRLETEAAIRTDPHLTDDQRDALLRVYRSYTAESGNTATDE